MKRIENPKNTERGRNAIPPRQEFIFPTHLFFYFPFFTQLQTAFIIGTSYAIAKLAPKRVGTGHRPAPAGEKLLKVRQEFFYDSIHFASIKHTSPYIINMRQQF